MSRVLGLVTFASLAFGLLGPGEPVQAGGHFGHGARGQAFFSSQLVAPQYFATPMVAPQTFAAPMMAPQIYATPMMAPQTFATPMVTSQAFATPMMMAPQALTTQLVAPQTLSTQLVAPQMLSTQLVTPLTLTNQSLTSQSTSPCSESAGTLASKQSQTAGVQSDSQFVGDIIDVIRFLREIGFIGGRSGTPAPAPSPAPGPLRLVCTVVGDDANGGGGSPPIPGQRPFPDLNTENMLKNMGLQALIQQVGAAQAADQKAAAAEAPSDDLKAILTQIQQDISNMKQDIDTLKKHPALK